MYLECLLISRNKTDADVEVQKIKTQKHCKSYSEVYQTKQYRTSIRSNQKYIDCQLSVQTDNNYYQSSYVLVSPLKADLQTCFDLFGQSKNTQIFIEPNLAPRVNSVTSISSNNSSLLQKFKHPPQHNKYAEDWYLSYGQYQQNNSKNPINTFIEAIQKKQTFQTEEHYFKRLQNFKKDLIIHLSKSIDKITLIGHPEVLQILTSTSHHEDYTLVNCIQFKHGQVKLEHIYIDGVQSEKEGSIPFCS